MDSESQSAQLLSQVESGIAELERTVQSFELMAGEVEKLMDEVEDVADADNPVSQANEQDLARALHASYNAGQRVLEASVNLDDAMISTEVVLQARALAEENNSAPLPAGMLVLDGRYRLVQLIYKRPRIHLYLARRLSDSPLSKTGEQPLVVIREIVLAGLSADLRKRIERAAFEEFITPRIFGSLHLPGVGDRVHVEHGRHYLVLQTRQTRGRRPVIAVTLAEHLPEMSPEPDRLDMSTALHWSIQLCRTVARLHRTNNILGELTPDMIIVPRGSRTEWAPLLLPGWPPSPAFWSGNNSTETQKLYNKIFPSIARGSSAIERDEHPFAAPEIFAGQRDERSDVYALGAILYLLLTRRSPSPASRRLRAEPIARNGQRFSFKTSLLRLLAAMPGSGQQFSLIPPHLLNEHISPLLEHILLRALALNPEQRFPSVLALSEALEGMKFKTDTSALKLPEIPQANASRMRKLLEWLKKELSD